jgi:hypothetical protein
MNKWVIPAVLIAFFAIGGADKAKKDKPPKDKPAKKASNDSIRTQQKTADAFAEKKSKPPTTQPSDRPPADDDLQAALSAIDEKIKAENDRFDALLTQLNEDEESAVQAGKEKDAAKVRKTTEKARATHNKALAALTKQREDLTKKKEPGPPADEKPTSDKRKSRS